MMLPASQTLAAVYATIWFITNVSPVGLLEPPTEVIYQSPLLPVPFTSVGVLVDAL